MRPFPQPGSGCGSCSAPSRGSGIHPGYRVRSCMNADVFIDTNVLLYTIDEDPASASKRQRAEQLLLSERWGWSVQVAAEFFVNATSARRPFKLAAPDAAALVETWFAFPTLDLTPALFRAAFDVHERFQLGAAAVISRTC